MVENWEPVRRGLVSGQFCTVFSFTFCISEFVLLRVVITNKYNLYHLFIVFIIIVTVQTPSPRAMNPRCTNIVSQWVTHTCTLYFDDYNNSSRRKENNSADVGGHLFFNVIHYS